MDKLSLMPGDMVIRNSIEVAFSKLVLIFFYYALMRRLWKKDYRQKPDAGDPLPCYVFNTV